MTHLSLFVLATAYFATFTAAAHAPRAATSPTGGTTTGGPPRTDICWTSVVTRTTTAPYTTTTTTWTTTTTTPTPVPVVPLWGQCGGIGYTGSTICAPGGTCVYAHQWFSQCLPSSGVTTTTTTTTPAPPTVTYTICA